MSERHAVLEEVEARIRIADRQGWTNRSIPIQLLRQIAEELRTVGSGTDSASAKNVRHFACPTCGPIAVDEDGCCRTCGADTKAVVPVGAPSVEGTETAKAKAVVVDLFRDSMGSDFSNYGHVALKAIDALISAVSGDQRQAGWQPRLLLIRNRVRAIREAALTPSRTFDLQWQLSRVIDQMEDLAGSRSSNLDDISPPAEQEKR